MVVGEEEVVVSALGGLAGAPAAVLSRLPVSQHHEPGDQDPGAGGVVAEQVAGTHFQLLQVLPLAKYQLAWLQSCVYRAAHVAPPADSTQLTLG